MLTRRCRSLAVRLVVFCLAAALFSTVQQASTALLQQILGSHSNSTDREPAAEQQANKQPAAESGAKPVKGRSR